MDIEAADWEVLAPQKKVVELRGKSYLVREMEYASDAARLKGDDNEGMLYMLTQCVFTPEGKPVFAPKDETPAALDDLIQRMKKLSRPMLNFLIDAALDVNGWNSVTNAAKPDAQPSASTTS